MIENHKLDKITGPSGVTAGYILLFFGLVTVYFTFAAIPVFLVGGAMAFSYRGTRINLERKQYQSYLSLFGFIRIGIFLPFEKSDILLVEHFIGKYSSYSLSNRKTDSEIKDFRVFLKTSYNDKKIPLAQFQSEEQAKENAAKLEKLIDALKI